MSEHTEDRTIVFDSLGDWVLGAVLWISGCVVALGGAALYYGVTRQEVATVIREGEFRSDVLTEAEAIDLIVALSHWGGLGLLVAGASIFLIGIAVLVGHRRARRDNRGTPAWIIGVVGATVSTILSFVPFSPVLGGAAAGYLDPDHAARGISVGAIAGVFASLPLFIVGLFTSVGLFVSGSPEAVIGVAVVLGIGVFFSIVYFIGLSALGGYLGNWVRKR